MKTISKFLLLAGIVLIGIGCEQHSNVAIGWERLEGIVSNESGDLLEGIKIEAYNDKDRTEHYYPFATVGEGIYTDKDGFYQFMRGVRYGEDIRDVYVVATDTTGVYEAQIIKGHVEYKHIIVLGENRTQGEGIVNFVLKKKQ